MKLESVNHLTDSIVIVINDVKHVIKSLLNARSGINRLGYLMGQIRAIQQTHNETNLAPENVREIVNEFKLHCKTTWSVEASSAIWQGTNRYTEATQNPSPVFNPEIRGKYAYIYRHPSEPRFGGIKAEKAWQFLEGRLEELFGERNNIAILHLADIARNYLTDGARMWGEHPFFIPSEEDMDNRSFQQRYGSLLKTGNALRHILLPDNLDDNRLSVLAGYVQDALRVGIASMESVQVTDDIGSIYRMGGNFTSCMRSLGCYDNCTQNSFQIYHDIRGCKIAYIAVPKTDSYGVVLNDRDGNRIMRLTARAILWDEVHVIRQDGSESIIKLMDTIYRDSSNEQASMVKWARQHGYAYKKTECAYSCSRFTYGPDRESEDFDLHDFRNARVVRKEGVWKRGMYKRVPWIDIFSYAAIGENYLAFHSSHDAVCLHSQSGSGGFLTEVVECQFCGEILIDDQNEEWRQDRHNRWTCPSCYDTEWAHCVRCNEEAPCHDLEEINEEWYCEHCTGEVFVRCEGCGTYINREDDWYTAPDGDTYCENCFNERYSYCECCDSYQAADEVIWYGDLNQSICNSCFDEYYCQCEHCDGVFDRDEVAQINVTREHDGMRFAGIKWLCEDCREELNVTTCDSCEELWDTLDPRCELVGEEEFLCTDCFNDRYRWCEFAKTYCLRRLRNVYGRIHCNMCHETLHYMSE